MLRLEGLAKHYGSRAVLDNVCLEADGHVHVVIGLNGSGKSTLLKAVAGILPLDAGHVSVNGRALDHLLPEDRNVGYVPQHPALFRHLTIQDNICYCLRNGRGSGEDILGLVEMLGLEHVLDQRPQTLSGGYQSRVSLARTLASGPEVMLLDEPLSDLDVAIKETLLPDFKKALGDRGIPVVYVTHDRMEAELLGDRFSVMIRGQLAPVDSADEAFAAIRRGIG